MADKNKEPIRQLHERLMKEFLKQISELISPQKGIIENNADVRKKDSGSVPSIKDVPAPLQEEHGGPDKINDIRREAAAAQSGETTQPGERLSPDKQTELMEIVRQRCEEFERELLRVVSNDKSVVESAAQKFKDELMDNARKKLTEKKYGFAD